MQKLDQMQDMVMAKTIFIILTLAGFASGAEMEVTDSLSVDGSSIFKSTAVFSGNVGIGTASPAATLDVAGTGTIKIPVGNTAQRPATAANGMMRFNTTTGKLEYYYNGWNSLGAVVATGGTIDDISVPGYRIHTFTTVGASQFTVTAGGYVEVLVVGGGGGSNSGQWGAYWGSGGGGGIVIYNASFLVTPGVKTVTVGVGGIGAGPPGQPCTAGSGGNSVFDTITATGGTGVINTSRTGGGNAIYSGGIGTGGTDATAGGGGGGAGGNGSYKNGGVGVHSSISGTDIGYGGGGSGGANEGAGTAVDGGGTGGYTPTPGDPNSGGGGGGALTQYGGDGGSGIVIIKYVK